MVRVSFRFDLLGEAHVELGRVAPRHVLHFPALLYVYLVVFVAFEI